MADSSDIDTEAVLTAGRDATAYQGSFERDTLTWTFAKLAEQSLEQFFSQAGSWERYERWLAEDAPLLRPDDDCEHGLYLVDLDLGQDGHLCVVARPPKGEFVLVAQHEEFHLVMASHWSGLTPNPEQDCVCLAHFEGDARLAARWALGLRAWLARQRAERDALPDSAGWLRGAAVMN